MGASLPLPAAEPKRRMGGMPLGNDKAVSRGQGDGLGDAARHESGAARPLPPLDLSALPECSCTRVCSGAPKKQAFMQWVQAGWEQEERVGRAALQPRACELRQLRM